MSKCGEGLISDEQPFNHPLLIAVKKIAPALATGNSVIVKPSEVKAVFLIASRSDLLLLTC